MVQERRRARVTLTTRPRRGRRVREGGVRSITSREKAERPRKMSFNSSAVRARRRDLRTTGGPPKGRVARPRKAPLTRKRKLEGKSFMTSARKRAMREKELEEAAKEAEASKKPETVIEKDDDGENIKEEPVGENAESSPLAPADSLKNSSKPVVKRMKPKQFITMRQPSPPPSSSSEEESETESESDNWVGPSLDVKTTDGALILVRNLPPEVTGRNLLFELFAKFPGIEQVSIHTDDEGRSLCTAEVAVSTVQQAKDVIRRCKNIVYRNHEIYMTMMGTSTIAQKAEEVIAPLPKELRRKDKKKRRKDRGEKSERGKSKKDTKPVKEERVTEEEDEEEEEVEVEEEVEAPKSPPPKPKKLRIQSPVAIVPETRPWNWGASKAPKANYVEQYIPPKWEENDETYYHVTMKKELQAHIPNIAGR